MIEEINFKAIIYKLLISNKTNVFLPPKLLLGQSSSLNDSSMEFNNNFQYLFLLIFFLFLIRNAKNRRKIFLLVLFFLSTCVYVCFMTPNITQNQIDVNY